MDAWIESVFEYLKTYASQYSFFLNGDYYMGLFSKYFSVTGFVIGFIFVLLVFFSSAEQQKKAGFFKVLPLVAVINSCGVIFTALNSLTGHGIYQYVPGMLGVPDNMISGFILTLVIASCYRGYKRQAFILGIVTYAAIPMINFAYVGYYSSEAAVQMIIRILLAGFICLIMSCRKCFYTSWIWYFVFHILIRTMVLLTPMFLNSIGKQELDTTGYTLAIVLNYYKSFRTDYLIFGIILVFAIIFERVIIPVKVENNTAK